MDPRSILVQLLRKFPPVGYRQYHSLFFACGFEGSYSLASKLEVIDHKHLILKLTNHDIYSWMLSINLWEELLRLFLLSTAYFHFSSIKRRLCWVLKPFRKPHWNFERIFSKYVNSWLLIIFSNISQIIGKMLTGL